MLGCRAYNLTELAFKPLYICLTFFTFLIIPSDYLWHLKFCYVESQRITDMMERKSKGLATLVCAL